MLSTDWPSRLNVGARRSPPAGSRAVLAIRWGAVVFGFVQVLTFYKPYPGRTELAALTVAGGFAAGSLALTIGWIAGRRRAVALAGLLLDFVVCMGFVYVYTFDEATAIFILIYVLPLEAAMLWGLRGALTVMGAATVLYTGREIYGHLVFGIPLLPESISFRMGIGIMIAAFSGALASSLMRERNRLQELVDQLAARTAESDVFLEALSDAGIGFVIAEDTRLTYVNDALTRITGYSREELLSTDIVDLFDREEAGRLTEMRRRRLQGDALPDTYETHLRHKDGRRVDIEAAVRLLEPAPPRVLAVIHDITERKRLDNLKDAFLTAVSHELRTPLTAILGFSATIHRSPMLRTEIRQDLARRMWVNARKLDRLLSDLLDLDRLAHGVTRPIRRRTNLGNLMQRVIAEIDGAQGRVTVETDGTTIAVDAAKVERIVANLVSNALKYTPPGTPIEASARRHLDGALVCVTDHGSGVPDELVESIFQPFERGDLAAHSPGVGVGLSIVSRFAELHEGRAWVERTPGGGASFRVYLPDAEPDETPPVALASPPT